MCPHRNDAATISAAVVVLVAGLAGLTHAQGNPPPPDLPPPPPSQPVEVEDRLAAYLSERNLDELLATHLRQRLAEPSLSDRARRDTADALGKLYAKQLVAAPSPQARQALEDRARELLKAVPEADSFELRINLLKTTYLKAEEIAERSRLRSATEDERAEAQRILSTSSPVLRDIATKIHRRVELLEKREQNAKESDVTDLRRDLAEARRLRSLARYYAAWTDYYLALLTKQQNVAQSALEHFGWLMNAADGKAATVDRLPRGLLKYEHIARAAVGCALANSLLGRDGEAVRWLEALEGAEALNPAVESQLFSRRCIILAAAGRWNEIAFAVNKRRANSDGTTRPLTAWEARLLAVLALEAGPKLSDTSNAQSVKDLGQLAIADLISAGELQQVLELVRTFGTDLVGREGFIAQYVRGVRAYEAARETHKKSATPDDPTADPALALQYDQAATLLLQALESSDLSGFKSLVPRVRLLAGLSLYYAGKMEPAATRFQAAAEVAESQDARRDALWYAVLALDRAVDQGARSLTAERDRVGTLYVTQFPTSENAARLLMRHAELISDAKAAEILLALPADSPLYATARRQASRMLYDAYRKATPGTARDFASGRFITVADEVMRAEARRSADSTGPAAADAANACVLLARQIADAALSTAVPDTSRAQSALDAIARVAVTGGVDLKPFEAELAFRRLQLAQLKGDQTTADELLKQLSTQSGPFARAALRQAFKRAADDWRRTSAPADARRVVNVGRTVLDQLDNDPAARADGTFAAVRDTVADAAAALWTAEHDRAMLELALRLDKEAFAANVRTLAMLRRLATTSEQAQDSPTALECWRLILISTPAGDAAAFEARYQSLRLLALSDPGKAREALTQHKVLHPDFGPEPWGSKLRELDRTLPPAKPAPAAPSTPPAGGGGGTR